VSAPIFGSGSMFIDNCDITNMSESIFRTDSSSSTVTMTNTRYRNTGNTPFWGVNPNDITESNNRQY
jgi:pectate lyase C